MTRRAGRALGVRLQAGDVLLLRGDLGSGKTAFTQGLAGGLGITQHVKSPSFILAAQYNGRLPLYHADFYRLTDPAQAAELGFEEEARIGVLVVEWPERAPGEMPDDHVLVEFAHVSQDERMLKFEAAGQRAFALIAELEEALPGTDD